MAAFAPVPRRPRIVAGNWKMNRTSLDGPALAREPGAQYGWDLSASPAARRVTLRMRDLRRPAWTGDRAPPPEAVLAQIHALVVDPQARGRTSDGWLPSRAGDSGRLHLDDIELLWTSPPAPRARRASAGDDARPPGDAPARRAP